MLRILERQTPVTVFDRIPLIRLIGKGFANHSTMTLPSYGYKMIASDLFENQEKDYSYGAMLRLDNGLDLYKNQNILQGLGVYCKQAEIKYLQFDKKLNIWTVPN